MVCVVDDHGEIVVRFEITNTGTDGHRRAAIAFLRRYPTQHSATRLTQAQFAAFLRRIAYCGRKPVEELFARVTQAPPAGLSTEETEGHATCVHALLHAVAAVRKQERELEDEIIERLDARMRIFTSLPRASHGVRAATLLAGIGDVRCQFPYEESLAALAGVAPVTKASGKYHGVGFRWAAGKKLRNALIDFAEGSRHSSPGVAKVYNDARARGNRHPQAVRILARSWVRVIWRCWQDNTTYNPQLHGGAMQLQAA